MSAADDSLMANTDEPPSCNKKLGSRWLYDLLSNLFCVRDRFGSRNNTTYESNSNASQVLRRYSVGMYYGIISTGSSKYNS